MSVIRLVVAASFAIGFAALPRAGAPSVAPKPPAKPAAAAPAAKRAAPAAARADTALFAGGCFWCMETQFEGVPGVKSVESGYTGGRETRPTYQQVSAHRTGHVEAVRVVFEPAVVGYPELLERFWYGIDPTQEGGQFCDDGDSYRTAIFWRNEAQRRAAEESRRALARSGEVKGRIVTAILPATAFWPAEEYHQDYWKKNPERYRTYREGCGRDRRLFQLWGRKAAKPLVH